jgi:hypothetical protein
MTDDTVRARFLFLGTSDGQKEPVAFLRPLPDDLEGDHAALHAFDGSLYLSHPENGVYTAKSLRKGMGYATPGTIFEIDRTKDGKSIIPASARAVGRWPLPTTVLRLQAEDRAREAARDGKKASAKLAETDELLEALAPIRAAYRNAVGTNRVQFLARIVAYITS